MPSIEPHSVLRLKSAPRGFLILTLAQFILNWGVRRAFMYPVARCLFGAVPTSQTARLASRARRKR